MPAKAASSFGVALRIGTGFLPAREWRSPV